MKKIISILRVTVFALTSAFSLSSCGASDNITVAIPNDTTNKFGALLLEDLVT